MYVSNTRYKNNMSKNERTALLNNSNTSVREEKPPRSRNQRSASNNIGFLFVVVFSSLSLDFGSTAKSQYVIQYCKTASNPRNITSNHSLLNVSENACGRKITPKEDEAGQKMAAKWNWYSSTVEHSITIPIVIIIGIYSDRIGRKPLFLISTIGMFLHYGMYAFIIYKKLPLYYFVIASGVEGLTGCRYLSSIATNAFIADTTERNQERTVALAVVDVFLGIGTFGATLGTGYMINSIGYFWPVVLTTGLNLLCIIIILCFVPETLKQRDKKVSSCNLFKNSMSFFYDKTQIHDNPRWKFFLCLILFILLEFASYAISGISTVYKMGYPICWNSKAIGWYSALTSLIHTALGAILLKILVKFGKDEPLAILGLLSLAGNRFLEGIATQSWMFYLGSSIGVLSSLPGTVIRSALSLMVDDSKQGSFFMVYELIVIMVNLAGSSLSNNLYVATMSIYRGFVYFVPVTIYIVMIILVIIIFISGGIKSNVEKKVSDKIKTKNKQCTEDRQECYSNSRTVNYSGNNVSEV